MSRIKPLKVAVQSINGKHHLQSLTVDHTFIIHNALETLIGALVVCQKSSLEHVAKSKGIKIGDVNFIKVESGYNVAKFNPGSKDNRIEKIIIEADVHTNASQEQLNELVSLAHETCPVYQMLKAAKVETEEKWNIKNL